jgi:inner membrane protein
MPTIFSHAAFASLAGKAAFGPRESAGVLLTAALCSIVPDFDVAAFALGIPYESVWGHRGFTHSISFAILFGAFCSFVYGRLSRSDLPFGSLFALFTLATFSHSLLDMLTNGGLGVALFAPFSGARFFLPWRPIQVSPIGSDFFSARGMAVVVSEFVWVWLPAVGLYLAGAAIRKIFRFGVQNSRFKIQD